MSDRYISRDRLIAANREAIRLNLNRTLNEGALARALPDSLDRRFPVQLAMHHQDAFGNFYYRVSVFIPGASLVIFDMTEDTYLSLPVIHPELKG
jgi:hypothetical protein